MIFLHFLGTFFDCAKAVFCEILFFLKSRILYHVLKIDKTAHLLTKKIFLYDFI